MKNLRSYLIVFFLLSCMWFNLNPLLAQQSFFQMLPPNASSTVDVKYRDIPFKVTPSATGYQSNFINANIEVDPANKNISVNAVFFLGMVTEGSAASAWWGPTERYYANNNTLFIGDRLGKIMITYQDTTVDVIPIIFGVNLWNYELLNKPKISEKNMQFWWGPYPEPFLSDQNAKLLLESSLVLMENDTIKSGKYILGIKTQNKPIAKILVNNEDLRTAGIHISGISCHAADKPLNPDWRLVDAKFFSKKEYFPAMDKLARRLYQFKDDLPATDPYNPPANYNAPMVKFTGTPLAEIYTNVFAHNIHDMRTKKLDANGGMHTSSGDLADFGIYIGMGTFKAPAKAYYDHIWTRDVGRCVNEIIESGETERSVKAADNAVKLLYDKSARFSQPNWKRIANASTLGDDNLLKSVSGKENDGHAAMMIFLYRLIQHNVVDQTWVKSNWKALTDAAEWYCWQMENPIRSGFNKVLSSESEASTQQAGTYDLFSNYYAYNGLKAYAKLAKNAGDKAKEERWNQYADKLLVGIMDMFTTTHPRYGKIFVDINYDCWTYDYKRLVALFLAPDLYTYDLSVQNPELYQLCYNTYLAQKEDYFNYNSGRQMGYGQGYITETAILMDDYTDMKGYIEAAAAMCYHHSDYNYIVPEGVIMHPSGRYWFRNSDLGNNVQQAEIVKAGRLLIGLDDLNPENGLNIIPRLPESWQNIEVKAYPVIAINGSGKSIRSNVNYNYKKIEDGFEFSMQTDSVLKLGKLRMGPFNTKQIKVMDGKIPCQLVTLRDQTFAYLDLSGYKGKSLKVKVVNK